MVSGCNHHSFNGFVDIRGAYLEAWLQNTWSDRFTIGVVGSREIIDSRRKHFDGFDNADCHSRTSRCSDLVKPSKRRRVIDYLIKKSVHF